MMPIRFGAVSIVIKDNVSWFQHPALNKAHLLVRMYVRLRALLVELR